MAKKAVEKTVKKYVIPRLSNDEKNTMAAEFITGRWHQIPDHAVTYCAGLILMGIDFKKGEIQKIGAVLGDKSEKHGGLYLEGKHPLFTCIKIVHKDDWEDVIKLHEEKMKTLYDTPKSKKKGNKKSNG